MHSSAAVSGLYKETDVNIEALKRERQTILAEAEDMLNAADAASRALTAEEQSRYDSIVARAEEINTEIWRASGLDRPVMRPRPSAELPDDEILPPGVRRAPIARFNAGARLQAFANDRAGHDAAYRSGQWLRAALLGDLKAMNWCQANGLAIDVRAAHSASENAKGGVLVPDELSRTIIRLVDEYGVFRRNSRVVPMSTDTLTIPRRTGGLTAHYVGENQEGTESDTAWDVVSLVAKKLMVLTRMSSEISEDAIISMADMLAMECALAFAVKEDTVGFTGDGGLSSGGIVGVLVKALEAAHPKAKVTASGAGDTCDVLAEITSDHLIDLMAAIPQYAKAGSKWYCSPTALELVFNAIKIAGGGNSLENLANAVQPRFLGYPIELSEVFPGDPTEDLSGEVMLGFGNLAQASTVGSRRELRFAMTDSRYWELDQIGVKATMRHDINVHDLGSATVKSPFAVLVGN
jgi:HK97 family phage major capsid protein